MKLVVCLAVLLVGLQASQQGAGPVLADETASASHAVQNYNSKKPAIVPIEFVTLTGDPVMIHFTRKKYEAMVSNSRLNFGDIAVNDSLRHAAASMRFSLPESGSDNDSNVLPLRVLAGFPYENQKIGSLRRAIAIIIGGVAAADISLTTPAGEVLEDNLKWADYKGSSASLAVRLSIMPRVLPRAQQNTSAATAAASN